MDRQQLAQNRTHLTQSKEVSLLNPLSALLGTLTVRTKCAVSFFPLLFFLFSHRLTDSKLPSEVLPRATKKKVKQSYHKEIMTNPCQVLKVLLKWVLPF